MITYVLFILALCIIALWNREHMTNADVEKLAKFQTSQPTSWEIKEDSSLTNRQLYGPEVLPPPKEQPRPAGHKNTKHNGTGPALVYPNVLGPEQLKVPGQRQNDTFDFYPAAEFPAGPAEPEPYLTDFSKLLKM